MRHGLGWFRVERQAHRDALSLSVWNGTEEDVFEISTSVVKMFDLDANPTILLQAMKGDKLLSGIWAQHPGLRLARSWSASEAMFAAVLGQVVSVRFGRVLTGELMLTAGTPTLHPKTSEPISLFPSAKQILEADLSIIRTSEARRTTIRALAQAIDNGILGRPSFGHPETLRKVLRSIPGIGTWTIEYVALRGFCDDDAFPATDYALKQELRRHPEMNIKPVRPFRGYAAVALWKRFAEGKRVSTDVVQ
jgi:DNA-3-methyladenine glycosylase II